VLAFAVPALLWLGRTGRERPPDWSCGGGPPPDWEVATATWRAGFGAHLAAAVLVLLAAVIAVSRARRTSAGLDPRPGLPSLFAAAPLAAWVLAAATDADVLDGLAIWSELLAWTAPFFALLGLCGLVWIATAAATTRGAAAAQVIAWVSLYACGIVVYAVMTAGEPGLCLD